MFFLIAPFYLSSCRWAWVSSCVTFIGRRPNHCLFYTLREIFFDFFWLLAEIGQIMSHISFYKNREFLTFSLIHWGISENVSKMSYFCLSEIGRCFSSKISWRLYFENIGRALLKCRISGQIGKCGCTRSTNDYTKAAAALVSDKEAWKWWK